MSQRQTERPNIVWILTDQHQADAIGAFSDGVVQTPNLDRLSGEGTTFTRAYCQGPLCAPSRASLLTERYVSDHGVAGNRWSEARPLPTMVQRIRDAGYHTAALGKMHLYPYPDDVRDGRDIMLRHGFVEVDEMLGKYGAVGARSRYIDHLAERGSLEAYRRFLQQRNPHSRSSLKELGLQGVPHWTTDPAPLEAEDHPDVWLGQEACRWIDGYQADKPFFLWIGFPGPHDPWDAPLEYVNRYRDVEIPLPHSMARPSARPGPYADLLVDVADYGSADSADADTIREVRRHYYAGVTMIDDAIGSIVDALNRRQMLDNTWIVYTSDHGEMLGAHGLFTKTLFYEESVRIPLIMRPPGGQVPRTVSDLVEHIDLSATLRDIAGTAELPGSSGHTLGTALDVGGRNIVRSECCGFGMWRTDRYKMVVHEESREVVQLFDLHDDPGEEHDLSGDRASKEVTATMLEKHVAPVLVSRLF